MMFEHKDGRSDRTGKDIPPYDLNAPIIDITDDDYGIWYMDALMTRIAMKARPFALQQDHEEP